VTWPALARRRFQRRVVGPGSGSGVGVGTTMFGFGRPGPVEGGRRDLARRGSGDARAARRHAHRGRGAPASGTAGAQRRTAGPTRHLTRPTSRARGTAHARSTFSRIPFVDKRFPPLSSRAGLRPLTRRLIVHTGPGRRRRPASPAPSHANNTEGLQHTAADLPRHVTGRVERAVRPPATATHAPGAGRRHGRAARRHAHRGRTPDPGAGETRSAAQRRRPLPASRIPENVEHGRLLARLVGRCWSPARQCGAARRRARAPRAR